MSAKDLGRRRMKKECHLPPEQQGKDGI